MYSSFSHDTYYIYLADQFDRPIAAQLKLGVSTARMKKIYDSQLRKDARRLKKPIREMSASDRANAADYLPFISSESAAREDASSRFADLRCRSVSERRPDRERVPPGAAESLTAANALPVFILRTDYDARAFRARRLSGATGPLRGPADYRSQWPRTSRPLDFLLSHPAIRCCEILFVLALGLYVCRIGLGFALPVLTLISIAYGSLSNSRGAISHSYQIVSLVLLAQIGAHFYGEWRGWKQIKFANLFGIIAG